MGVNEHLAGKRHRSLAHLLRITCVLAGCLCVVQGQHNSLDAYTCNTACIPKGVKLKAGKSECCATGHETLKCPGPAHYTCGSDGNKYECIGSECTPSSSGVDLKTCQAACPPSPPPPPPPPAQLYSCIKSVCTLVSTGSGVNATVCQSLCKPPPPPTPPPPGSGGTKIWNSTVGNCSTDCSGFGGPIVLSSNDEYMYIQDEDGNTYALNASTGAHIWNGTGVSSGISYLNGPLLVKNSTLIVYNSTGTYLQPDVNTTNFIVALDALDGSLLWSVPTDPVDQMVISMDGNIVFLLHSYFVSSGAAHIRAINTSDGAHVWKSDGYNGLSSMTLSNGGEVLYTYNDIDWGTPPLSGVYAMNTKTGDLIWTFPTHYTSSGPENKIAISNDGNIVFLSTMSNQNLAAINASNGGQVWILNNVAPILLGQATAYVSKINGSSEVFSNICAIDILSGDQGWCTEPMGVDSINPTATLSEDGRVIYFGGEDTHIRAIDTLDGTLIWKYATGNVCGNPIISGDGKTIYVGDGDGYDDDDAGTIFTKSQLYALNALDGTKIWNYTTGQADPPVISNGGKTLYVTSSLDGKTWAIDAIQAT